MDNKTDNNKPPVMTRRSPGEVRDMALQLLSKNPRYSASETVWMIATILSFLSLLASLWLVSFGVIKVPLLIISVLLTVITGALSPNRS